MKFGGPLPPLGLKMQPLLSSAYLSVCQPSQKRRYPSSFKKDKSPLQPQWTFCSLESLPLRNTFETQYILSLRRCATLSLFKSQNGLSTLQHLGKPSGSYGCNSRMEPNHSHNSMRIPDTPSPRSATTASITNFFSNRTNPYRPYSSLQKFINLSESRGLSHATSNLPQTISNPNL